MLQWLFRRQDKKAEAAAPQVAVPQIHRVLLVAGGSRASQAAADFAMKLAGAADTELYATVVIDTESLDMLQAKGVLVEEENREFSGELEEKGRRYLERLKVAGAAQGRRVTTELVKGRFVKSIQGLIEQWHIDMVVMGRSNTSVKDVSGRVRQALLDSVSCPVAVIKAPAN